MNKAFTLVASVLMIVIVFGLAAFAGGGASGDYHKGYVTEVDKAAGTIVLEPHEGEDSRVLTLGKGWPPRR